MPCLLPPARIRALALVLALFFLCGCAGLTANCVSGDCVNGQGTVVGLLGWSYAGQFQAGQAQGKGTFTWMDGTRFDGSFEGGRRVGPGVLTRVSGQVVRGVWNDVKGVGYQNSLEFAADPPVREAAVLAGCIQGDCVNGQGTLILPTGQKYVGQFKDGKRHGQGSVTFVNGLNGQSYIGELRDDKANGQGTQIWPNGNKYVGEFRDDKPNGQGTFTRPDGHRYVGEFKDGKANGQGTVSSLNGHSYVGELKDDKANGQGTVTYPNGQRYVGDFRDDRRSGLGLQTTPGQPTQWGIWANDVLVQPLSEQEFATRRANADGQASQGLALAGEKTRLEAERQKAGQPTDRPKATGPQQRRVALVIGNGAYKEAPLKNPANDARDIAATLKRLGFEVILRTNADLPTMDRAVDEFYASLKRGGTGLFYFAGHGLQVGGINYLVPVGARLQSESDARYQAVDAGRVLGKMEDAGNDLNLVILDACRNNPFARSFRSASLGLAKMDAPTGSLIAYATAPGSVAADGDGQNGVYTKHLLKNLTTQGLSVEEMFKRVRLGVVGETKKAQVPWEASSLTGNFSFAE